MRTVRRLAALLVGIVLAGCGSAPSESTVTVSAAPPLTDAFSALGKAYEHGHPGARIVITPDGQSADVLAAEGQTAPKGRVFAYDQLVIAVAPGDPHQIVGLTDLARPGIRVAICAESTPCGAATTKVLAGINPTAVTRESDAQKAIQKVRQGEADATLVYRTDLRAAGGTVDPVEFPESRQAIGEYRISALADKSGATDFVGYVLSEAGQQILANRGFQGP